MDKKLIVLLASFISSISTAFAGYPDLSPRSGNGWSLMGGQGMMQFILVDKSKSQSNATYQDAIHVLCKNESICALHFWVDKRYIPINYSRMSDEEANAETAIYGRNRNTGLENFMWNCRIKNEPDKCFK